MNNVQIRGAVDRLIIIGLTWLAAKGWITTAQVAEYAPILLAILTSVYAYWVNRDTNLVSKAANVPGTTVVTTPEIAAATPNQTNVVSSSESNASINASVKENK